MEVDLYFGHRGQFEYVVGDNIHWLRVESVAEGGRPKDGNLNGEGYAECPHCKRDFFAKVIVRNDTILKVEIDNEKKGYIGE